MGEKPKRVFPMETIEALVALNLISGVGPIRASCLRRGMWSTRSSSTPRSTASARGSIGMVAKRSNASGGSRCRGDRAPQFSLAPDPPSRSAVGPTHSHRRFVPAQLEPRSPRLKPFTATVLENTLC